MWAAPPPVGLGQDAERFPFVWPGMIRLMVRASAKLARGAKRREGRLSDLQALAGRASTPARQSGRAPVVVEGPYRGPGR